MADFNSITEREIRSAISPNNVQMTGQAPTKRYFAEALDGLRPLHILTLGITFRLTPNAKSRLLALRDQLVARQELLMLISESETFMEMNELTEFISDEVNIESPYFLALGCYGNKNYQITIDGLTFEALQPVIEQIRWGGIAFAGPIPGLQSVNMEVMKDSCWKCRQPMRTVTGLVFPDQQLPAWDNDRWLYYNPLVALESLPDKYALPIQ